MYNIHWAKDFIGFTKNDRMDLHGFVKFFAREISNRDFEYLTTDP